ncbi:MAG TPA: hypothetical protein VM871_07795, partial [Flavisolibacter sp.]|nr:hypothetical protein [Flavisolibacter sp.]
MTGSIGTFLLLTSAAGYLIVSNAAQRSVSSSQPTARQITPVAGIKPIQKTTRQNNLSVAFKNAKLIQNQNRTNSDNGQAGKPLRLVSMTWPSGQRQPYAAQPDADLFSQK